MYQETCTLTCVGENSYNLLIQNPKGHVVMYKREVPFWEAVAEIENRMYISEESDGAEQ